MKNFFVKVIKNKVGKIVCLVLLACIIFGIIILCFRRYKPKVDTKSMIATLQESSELTTAKLTFRGLAEYKDTGTKYLNRADYKMLFRATARIGIDVQKIEIDKDIKDKKIIVKIPKATVIDIKIHTGKEDMQFFDEKFALFNTNEKEDHNTALALAEKSAIKEIQEMGSLKMADDQAKTLVKGILANAIPNGYEIVVKNKE